MANYTWVFSLISIILVFVGWGVVYFNARRIATRSETKSLMDNIIKLVESVSETSISFWLSKISEDDVHKAKIHDLLISAKLSQLSDFFKFIRARGVVLSDVLLAEMNDKATIDSDIAYTLSEQDAAIKAQAIQEVCARCIAHVFDEFEKTHPPSSPKSILERMNELDKSIVDWSESLGSKALD